MLIVDLVLHTPNLENQYNFYIQNLGFPLVEKWPSAFCFRAGRTHFTFLEYDTENKIYHFAFGLKENKTQAALEFYRHRVEVIPNEGDSSEIVEFPAWNARAFYLYDADGNVVEFIARCNPIKAVASEFSISDVKSVCEMGLPVDSVEKSYLQFKKSFKLEKCAGYSENFCPVGDQDGMFILVPEDDKMWFPTHIPAEKVDFKAFIQHHDHKGKVSYCGGKLSML